MHETTGPSLLSSYLRESGRSYTDFARAVGCHQTTIGRIANGEVVPSIALACAIQREAKIPVEAWAPQGLESTEAT